MIKLTPPKRGFCYTGLIMTIAPAPTEPVNVTTRLLPETENPLITAAALPFPDVVWLSVLLPITAPLTHATIAP